MPPEPPTPVSATEATRSHRQVSPRRQYWELVSALSKRDLKARYKESALGFLWSLASPVGLTLILWLVFGVILRAPLSSGPAPFWLHLLVSVLAWNFILGSITESTHSLIANASLLKKVPLDPSAFPAAAVASNGVHFLLAMLVALPIAALRGPGPSPIALLALPLAIAAAALLALAVGMLLAAANVFYRDVSSALNLIGIAWFYGTPVLYGADRARASLSTLGGQGSIVGQLAFDAYLLNPAAPIIMAIRRALLYPTRPATGLEVPDETLVIFLAASALTSLILFLIARAIFHRVGPDFADEL